MRRESLYGICAALVFIVAMSERRSFAAVIEYTGSAINANNATSVKQYGADGYTAFGVVTPSFGSGSLGGGGPNQGPFVNLLNQTPSYIASDSLGVGVHGVGFTYNYWGSSGYATFGSPTGSLLRLGLAGAPGVSRGSQNDLFSFETNSSIPTFTVGILEQEDLNPVDYLSDLRLRQTIGLGGGDTGLIATAPQTTDFALDYYFFNIVDAKPGDVFTLSGVQNHQNAGDASTNDVISGFVFSSNAVPEPSSLALIGTGGLLMLRRRRQKSSLNAI